MVNRSLLVSYSSLTTPHLFDLDTDLYFTFLYAWGELMLSTLPKKEKVNPDLHIKHDNDNILCEAFIYLIRLNTFKSK